MQSSAKKFETTYSTWYGLCHRQTCSVQKVNVYVQYRPRPAYGILIDVHLLPLRGHTHGCHNTATDARIPFIADRKRALPTHRPKYATRRRRGRYRERKIL